MKKLILIPLFLLFANCDVTLNPANAGNTKAGTNLVTLQYPVRVQDYKVGGITYKVFSSHYGESGVHVVNHTKELLEMELIRLQIEQLKTK